MSDQSESKSATESISSSPAQEDVDLSTSSTSQGVKFTLIDADEHAIWTTDPSTQPRGCAVAWRVQDKVLMDIKSLSVPYLDWKSVQETGTVQRFSFGASAGLVTTNFNYALFLETVSNDFFAAPPSIGTSSCRATQDLVVRVEVVLDSEPPLRSCWKDKLAFVDGCAGVKVDKKAITKSIEAEVIAHCVLERLILCSLTHAFELC